MKREDYVSLEVAKLLKEKNYDVPTREYYSFDKNKLEYGVFCVENNKRNGDFCSAPTLYEIAKWLRETHDIAVCVHPYGYSWDYTLFNLSKINDDYNHVSIISNVFYKTYEEALNEGIKEALKYI